MAALIAAGAVAADLAAFPSADELWGHIQQLQRGPTGKPASPAEARTMMLGFLNDLDAALAAFIQRHPADPRRWEAKQTQAEAAMFRAQVEEREPDRPAVEALLNEVAGAAEAPVAMRTDARHTLIELHAASAAGTRDLEAIRAVEREIAGFQEQHPQDPRLKPLGLIRADLYETADPAKREALLKELAASDLPRVSREAARRLKQLELTKTPVALKFTAVDGTEVDLAKLRGKVVLVDFWATWCGPCRVEIPNLVKTHQQYHAKGFEVVGISLDQDKARLLSFTRDKAMTWPQYFDGKGWENEISRQFGIEAIPAMWLLDKTGKIRSTDARGPELAKQVEKLLAE